MTYLVGNCELKQRLTLDQAVLKLKNSAPKPICAIVFGADDSYNEGVTNKITKAWGLGSVIPSFDSNILARSLRNNSLAVVKMSPEESVDHGKRLAMFEMARRCSARTVVGVYVSLLTVVSTNGTGTSKEMVEQNKRARLLAKFAPTMEGLDYMIEL